MTCGSAREAILDLARGEAVSAPVRAAADQHLRECASCAAELDRQRDLTAALGALAVEAETWRASPAIEERLREAFVAQVPVTSMALESNRSRRWIYALPSAAAIALMVWLGSRPSMPPSPGRGGSAPAAVASPARVTPGTGEEKPAASMVETDVMPERTVRVRAAAGRRAAAPKPVTSFEFLPLPGAAGLPDLESASIVRVAVPIGALPEYGLDIAPGGSKTTVDADVLVGQDGMARAIRLISAEESAIEDTRSRR